MATIENWKQILSEQIELIHASGLGRCAHIDYCKVGEGKYNLDFAMELPDLEEFEFPTLMCLYDNSNKDGYCFYIHLKGVSKTQKHWEQYKDVYEDFAGLKNLECLVYNEKMWRKYLEYFIIEKYKDCIAALEDHDLVGVEWREKPYPHFCGNFWWAKNDYVRKLSSPVAFRLSQKGYFDILKSDRSLAEFWIGSGNPRVKVLHNTGENLYHYAVRPDLYRNFKIF